MIDPPPPPTHTHTYPPPHSSFDNFEDDNSLILFQNPVDHKILSKMVMAFYQKLMYVCEARVTMAARGLPEFIENKLKSALIFDPDSGQPYVAIEDQVGG